MTLPPPDPRLISGYKDDTLGQQDPDTEFPGTVFIRREKEMLDQLDADYLREARLLHLGFWALLGAAGAFLVKLVGLSMDVPITLYAAGGLIVIALLWIAGTGLARTWTEMEAYAK